MKKTTKVILLMLFLSIIVGMFNVCWATQPTVEWYFSYELEPKEIPDSAGPMDLLFNLTPTESCPDDLKEVKITVEPSEGLKYLGPNSWVINVEKGNTYSTDLKIVIPKDDSSHLFIKLEYGNKHRYLRRFFVTTGELVEFWKGYPSGRYWKYPKYEPDTTKYEVKIDLRVQRRFDYIDMKRDFFGPLQPSNDSGFYIIKITRELFNDLIMEGFKCDYIEEPPPVKPGPSGVKSTIQLK